MVYVIRVIEGNDKAPEIKGLFSSWRHVTDYIKTIDFDIIHGYQVEKWEMNEPESCDIVMLYKLNDNGKWDGYVKPSDTNS